MKKGVKKIICGTVLLIIGMALPFVLTIPFFLQIQEEGEVFRGPGVSRTISIDEPGRYYLWHNYSTVFEGRSYSFPEELPDGLSFSLTEQPSGNKIPMQSGSGFSEESGSRKKSSIGYFEVTEPGRYTVTISGNTEQRIFSLGKSSIDDLLGFFIKGAIGMVIALGAAIAAAVLIILGIVQLCREHKTANNPG